MPIFRYRPSVLEALARHGLNPSPATPPDLPRDYVNDLYRFELRRLRDRLRRGEFPTAELAGRVDATRRRYAVLGLPIAQWAEVTDDPRC
jgi:hypothetical protein